MGGKVKFVASLSVYSSRTECRAEERAWPRGPMSRGMVDSEIVRGQRPSLGQRVNLAAMLHN